MGRTRWHNNLISFSEREQSVPGGEPRRERRREVMESMGVMEGCWGGGVDTAWCCRKFGRDLSISGVGSFGVGGWP